MRTIGRSVMITVLLLAALTCGAAAQAPGYADILNPQRGDVLAGIITITGSASHPSFTSYQLAFALDPNESGTWFPISGPMDTEVTDGNLGIWDTTGLSDGYYQIRLRVELENGTELESLVSNLQIRNYTDAASLAVPAITAQPASGTIAPTATATEEPVPIVTVETPQTDNRVFAAFRFGALLGGAGLLLLGALLALRNDYRHRRHWLRMRQLLRKRDVHDDE